MVSALHQYIEGWSPSSTVQTDVLDEHRALLLADLLDAPGLADDGELPPTWQWGYFSDWPPYDTLNADGHPADGPFQPPIPQRRRMWAGGSVESRAPLRVGLQVERRGTLLSAVPKSGRSGDMVLVGVQYDYLQDGELALREVQNHVYRAGDAEQAPRDWPPAPDSPPSSDAPWQHVVQTDPIRLFRMSALTANSHRIHYDRPYATEVEGFRDLVVHGPMLAQQLAVLHRRVDPALRLARFDYRLLAPVFVGDPVAALGTPRGEDADLEVRSAPDRVHVSATASYRRRA